MASDGIEDGWRKAPFKLVFCCQKRRNYDLTRKRKKARQAKEEQNKNNVQEEQQGMGNSSSVFDENSSSVLKQEINSLRTKIERMESELLFLRQKVDLYEKENFSY